MKRFLPLALLTTLFASCTFPNDLDYPLVLGAFEDFAVEGQKSVRIDASARTVTVDLEETADMEALKVTSCLLSEGSRLDSPLTVLDLTEPLEVTIHTYQDYVWTISATQNVERYVRCLNQVGDAQFNPLERTVVVAVSDNQPLTSVRIQEMKLEPEGSEIVSTTGYYANFNEIRSRTEDCVFPMTLDCVLDRTFRVKYRGKDIEWVFKAVQVEVKLMVASVDAYAHRAHVRGLFPGEGEPWFEYRPAASSDWIRVDASIAGTGLSADLIGLEADTDYLLRVNDGSTASGEYPFHTEATVQLDNMNFDSWHADGKCWFPWLKGGTQVWDSANKATSSFTGSATTPDETFVAVEGEGKKACKLESSYALVKFAAGSVFTGTFVGLQGLGAELAWGVPFTVRPTGLKGYAAYRTTPITDTDSAHGDLKGQNDTGHILMILTDWDDQFHVISDKKQFVDFDNDPAIIAYGRFALSETTDGYIPFTLNLEYRSTRIPKYVVVVASSSALGDYFTGGRGSTFWLDELEFTYD